MIRIALQLCFSLFLVAVTAKALSVARRELKGEVRIPMPIANTAPHGPRKAAEPSVFSPPALSAFRDTLARPLFVEGRRPPEPKPKATPPVVHSPAAQMKTREIALDQYRLMGTAMFNGKRRALITAPHLGQRWMDEGDQLDDWVVEKILAESAELRSRGREGQLLLYPLRSER